MGEVVHASFGGPAQKVPNKLIVRSDGMMVARHEGLRDKQVLLDLPPTVVPSVMGSARGFAQDGTELRVNVRTTTTSERPQQNQGKAPTPLLESLVGQEAEVATKDGALKGTVVGFTVAGNDLLAVLETKADGVSTATLVSLRDAKLSVTMGGKTTELAPKTQTVAFDAGDAELSGIEYLMPGNKWGVLYRVHLSDGKALLDTSIVWENPFGKPISVEVRFENVASYSAQPDLNLAADPLSSVSLGDRVRAAPHVERPIARRTSMAALAMGAPARGGAARRMAGAVGAAAAGAAAIPVMAVNSLMSMRDGAEELDELSSVEEVVSYGFQVSSGAIPIVHYTPKDRVEAGPHEKVTIPIGTKERFEGRLLLIADIDNVYHQPTEAVPIECARFKSGKQQLLQGQATVYYDGKQIGSTELEFTRPNSDVTLAVREAREFSVMAHQINATSTESQEIVKQDGRYVTKTTYSRSRTVAYVVDNTGEDAREVLVGHAQARPDSKLQVIEGTVDVRMEEKTRSGKRFSVDAKPGTTKLVVKETWTEATTQYVGWFRNWWHNRFGPTV